jgi:hypothetical protein
MNDSLNGELHEEVYMRPLSGYSIPEGMVCYIHRSLYGLKRAPRAWSQLMFFLLVSMIRLSLFTCHDMIIVRDDTQYIAFVKSCLSD